jgi:uncharacterized glyoxalase superfamily protein PhnB
VTDVFRLDVRPPNTKELSAMLTLDAITVAADDPAELKAFYESALGATTVADHGVFVSYALHPDAPVVGVMTREALAADAGVPAEGSGFRGVTLSYIVDNSEAVDSVLAAAADSGGTVVKPARNAMWGGYSGHVADPSGTLWKIVWPRRRGLFGRSRTVTTGDPVTPREVVTTLGARDIPRTKGFYEELGVTVDKDYKKFVSLRFAGGAAGMALYGWDALADDAGVAADGGGFRGFVLSHTAESADQVDSIIRSARTAGGRVVTAPATAQWGGYGGSFTDPDGCLWKVASTG